MNLPITPPLPVNAIISVQPLSVAVPGRDAGDATAQLSTIPPGTTVQGFVINRDAQSNPIVRTNLGDYLVNSDVFIKTGSEVSFRLDSTQLAGRARIISIDGLTPDEYVGQGGRAVTSDTIAPSNVTTAQATQTPRGAATPAQAQLEAVVLKAIAIPLQNIGAEPIPASLAQLQPGQKLRVIIQSLQLPQATVALQQLSEPTQSLSALLPKLPQATASPSAATTSPANPLPNNSPTNPAATLPSDRAPAEIRSVIAGNAGVPVQTTTAASSANAATPAATNPQLPPAVSPLVGQEISAAAQAATAQAGATNAVLQSALTASNANTANAQTSAAPTPALQPLSYAPAASRPTKNAPLAANGPTISATVIGHEGDGATILQTPFATVKLYTQQPLPYGTTLTIQATKQETAPLTPLPIAADEAQTLGNTARTWQELLDALTPLQDTNIQALRTVFQQIPAPNTHLASSLLFFLAAVKGGDVKEWLGAKALDRLRLISPNIALRMGEDIAQLQQLLTPQPGSSWTGIPLPIMYQNTLQNAQLYLRHEDEKEGGKVAAGKTGQRFIVDVELSQLGPMQLDGFVRPGEVKKQFDLVIRSALNLPDDVTQGIRATFETTLQIAGLAGQAIFQQGNQHFVRPLAERAAPASAPPNTILA